MSEDEAPSAPGSSTPSDSAVSTPGRGGRGRGHYGRSRGRGGRSGNRNGSTRNTTVPEFKGNTDGMKGNVFQCHGKNINKQQFLKMVGVLEEDINKTFEYLQDVASICKTFSIVALVQPENLTTEEYTEDMGKKMIWEKQMKTYMKRMDMLKSNQRGIYAIIWGQCSSMIQSKVEPLDNYKSRSNGCDCIWLLEEIQGITHQFEGTRNVFISLDNARSNYYAYKQSNDQTLHAYLKDYQSLVQVLEHYGVVMGSVGPYVDSVKEAVRSLALPGTSGTELLKRAIVAAKHKSIADSSLKRADRRRYGGFWS
jgi:hypothetical protein